MKTFAYIRKSTDEKGNQENSLAYQKREIEERFGSKYQNIAWHEESESAVKTGKRPEFTKLCQDIAREQKKGEKCALIAHNLDRITRNLYDTAKLEDLRRDGLDIHTCTDGNIQSVLLLMVRAGLAMEEIQTKKIRVEAAWDEIVGRGEWCFSVPIGYKKGAVKNIKEPDEKKAPAIKQIFEEFLVFNGGAREFLPRAKEIFSAYSIKTLQKSALYNLLKNKYYVGILDYRGKEHEGKHLPIVPRQIFDAVQKKLKDNTKKKVVVHSHLFRGLVTCFCGRKLIGELQKGNVYYRCHSKACDIKSIKEDILCDAVQTTLTKLHLTPESVEPLLATIRGEIEGTAKNAKQKTASLSASLIKTEEEMKGLTLSLSKGHIPKVAFDMTFEDLEKKAHAIRSELSHNSSEFTSTLKNIAKMLELVRSGFLSWSAGDKTTREQILILTGSNCSIEPDYTVSVSVFSIFQNPQKEGKNDMVTETGHSSNSQEYIVFNIRWQAFEKSPTFQTCLSTLPVLAHNYTAPKTETL